MSRLALLLPFAALALTGCTTDDGSTGVSARIGAPLTCPATKVLVCHLPPGNPANMQEICVGPAAVDAHVRNHGDHVGACAPAPTCGAVGQPCGTDTDCCTGLACPNEDVCTIVTPT